MSDSLSNKELVAVGHQFAKAMSSDTAIMDIAKIVSRLAERLDCTTLALREMTKQRDALKAEPVAYNQVQRDQMNSIVTNALRNNLERVDKLVMADIFAVTMALMQAGFRTHSAPAAPVVPEEWQQWIADVAEYLEGGLEADGELEAEGSIEAKRLLSRRAALLAAAPDCREIPETSICCTKCGGRGSYHCPQMLGTVECECTLPAAVQQEVK